MRKWPLKIAESASAVSAVLPSSEPTSGQQLPLRSYWSNNKDKEKKRGNFSAGFWSSIFRWIFYSIFIASLALKSIIGAEKKYRHRELCNTTIPADFYKKDRFFVFIHCGCTWKKVSLEKGDPIFSIGMRKRRKNSVKCHVRMRVEKSEKEIVKKANVKSYVSPNLLILRLKFAFNQ